LFDRYVVMPTVDDFAAGAQRLREADHSAWKLGPGFCAVEGLDEVVLQRQSTLPREPRGA
jgi:hypothetical protein